MLPPRTQMCFITAQCMSMHSCVHESTHTKKKVKDGLAPTVVSLNSCANLRAIDQPWQLATWRLWQTAEFRAGLEDDGRGTSSLQPEPGLGQQLWDNSTSLKRKATKCCVSETKWTYGVNLWHCCLVINWLLKRCHQVPNSTNKWNATKCLLSEETAQVWREHVALLLWL